MVLIPVRMVSRLESQRPIWRSSQCQENGQSPGEAATEPKSSFIYLIEIIELSLKKQFQFSTSWTTAMYFQS